MIAEHQRLERAVEMDREQPRAKQRKSAECHAGSRIRIGRLYIQEPRMDTSGGYKLNIGCNEGRAKPVP